ncbi:hypothetical protein [Gardnerella sp. KA00747]|uniref:hypothetical protein n=1 Tax=Gardnerella sp. KA00747 TaxID=2749078 RepID=UPI003BAD0F8A
MEQLRDDLLERCDLAREGNSERELAQVESTVCFQRKRGLPSSRLTKAGQISVVVHWEFGCVL